MKKKFKVRFPLVIKLIVITTIIVVVSAGVATLVSSYFFTLDTEARTEENNMTMVEVFATRMENELQEVYSSSVILLDTLKTTISTTTQDVLQNNFFSRNPKIAFIGIQDMQCYNDKFFISYEKDKTIIQDFYKSQTENLNRAKTGRLFAVNVSAYFDVPMLAILAPYKEYGSNDCLVIIFSTEELHGSNDMSSAYTSYAISNDKSVLVYPDYEILRVGVLDRNQDFYDRIYESEQSLFQFLYEHDGRDYFIAASKVDFGRFVAISEIPATLVYEAINLIIIRNVVLVLIILFLAILAIWFFAKSISMPVIALKEAAEQIETGNYIVKLKSTTSDEIGLLTQSFVKMGKGLAEKERLRETFGRFVNKEIAAKAARGELKLGGERKNATVFFSDIRSFTAISESLSPEKVVEFLNEYMTKMVDCIEATGGVVDKFIGDSIMGIWGAPLSTGNPSKDAELAIKSMLLMRRTLYEFNIGRGTPDKPLIKIGCGVNSGPCLAGQIGSSKRMEYTVIGDTVNTASRMEALNKPFGTDILISEHTYKLLQNKIIVEPMPSIKVKGKEDALQIYALINFKDAEGPKTLKEVRTLMDIKEPKNKIDPDKEEIKYEILSKK